MTVHQHDDDSIQSAGGLFGAIASVYAATIKVLNPSQVCFLCMALTFAGAFYSFKTYARNEDFVGFVKQYQEEQIISNSREGCKATRAGREATLYSERVQHLQADYERTTGHRFREPRCDQL